MVSSITQDPYSIIISLNLASFVNLNIGAPPRSTELSLGVVHAWVGQNVTYSRHGHSKATRAPRTLTGAGICLKRLYIVFRDTSAVGIRT